MRTLTALSGAAEVNATQSTSFRGPWEGGLCEQMLAALCGAVKSMVHAGKHKFFGVLVVEKVRAGAIDNEARRIKQSPSHHVIRGQPQMAREAIGSKVPQER
ncbi:hypothetical protein PAL_GLEAN10015416 [Pteropus alecto]|uniref:Uncharacterized protein n=1 Tax=Pteropus alecto TaxID=9402 RepID=L5KG17_PTEAL|nr:hypothetical protein PAL_GLEAN10015416 [Pteropus alecto]